VGSEGDGLYVESDEGWSGDVRTYVATAMTKRGDGSDTGDDNWRAGIQFQGR